MKFNVNQQDLQKSLNYCQGVIEKRSTLPILSNVLLDVSNSKLTITATDLDMIFIHSINNVEIIEEGKTTTTSSIMYDIIRKFSSGKKINFSLSNNNKLQLESEKSIFHLNCINSSEFPLTDENFIKNEFAIKSKQLLKLLNKCKFSISNDETRHYLSGIFFHQNQIEDKIFLNAVATDSHRMSISKLRLNEKVEFEAVILPKKTIFQLCLLLEDYEGDVKISNINSKIKIRRSELPKLSNESHYWSDLEGLSVLNSEEKLIGIVDSLIETGANDVMVVNTTKDKRILIPFVMHEIIKEVSIELNYVKVDWQIDSD